MKATWRADLELAVRATEAAGQVLRERFGSDLTLWSKGPGQPVTDADLAANRILGDTLRTARPDYGWLSEETPDDADRLALRRVWIIDPLDGTRSFIAGRPEFAVSVGLAVAGRPVIGVVYHPVADELFWSVAGEGAYCRSEGGERRLRVTVPRSGAGGILVASRHEIDDGEFATLEDDWKLLALGSTAYKLAVVAAGRGDGFLSRGPKSEWDLCAGELLVEEAGGRVTDRGGRPLAYNQMQPAVAGVVASNGAVHERLLSFVARMPPAHGVG